MHVFIQVVMNLTSHRTRHLYQVFFFFFPKYQIFDHKSEMFQIAEEFSWWLREMVKSPLKLQPIFCLA